MAKASTTPLVMFATLSLVMAGIKLLFDYYPGDFPLRDQASAFTWEVIGGITLIAFAGVFASRAAGLPEPFEDAGREREGIWAAIAIGALYGAITIWMDINARQANPNAAWVHMDLPWSIPFYTFGAIFLEFLLRLGGLCVVFWFVHVVLLRRRLRLTVFWIVNVIVALYEIWPHIADDVAGGRWEAAARGLAGPLYLSNVFEGWLMLRYSWLAPIVFRLAFYAIWHILYPGLVTH
jgi:hypothetical protein